MNALDSVNPRTNTAKKGRNTADSGLASPKNGTACHKVSKPEQQDYDAKGFILHMQKVASDAGLRKMGLERIEFELAEARRGRCG